MPQDWPTALALLLGLFGIFAIVIFIGLRTRRGQIARNLQDITAETVWNEMTSAGGTDSGADRWNRDDLLYGIWQDFSASTVGMIVKDCRDSEVARIRQEIQGITITAGPSTYRVVAQMGWRTAAGLSPVRGNEVDRSSMICSFERRGWIRNRVARYRTPADEVIEIPIQWGLSFSRCVFPIRMNGEKIGALSTIGGPRFNQGRAVILPSALTLPVRLFVLAFGAGLPSGRSH